MAAIHLFTPRAPQRVRDAAYWRAQAEERASQASAHEREGARLRKEEARARRLAAMAERTTAGGR